HAVHPGGGPHGSIPGHDGPRGNTADDARLGRDLGAVAHASMIGNSGLPADLRVRSDANRPGETALRGDERARTDDDVVTHVDVPINLASSPADGRSERPRGV